MSNFAQQFADADPDASQVENEPPADGRYDVALVDASAFTSKKGADIVTLKLRLTDGSDHEWTVLQGFKSQAAANITKKVVRAIGASIDNVTSIEDLDGRIKDRIGNYYVVDVSTSGTWRNTYFVEDAAPTQPDLSVGEQDFGPVTVPAGATADESIPF